MSSFFRSNKSASSSSTDLAKAGPETSEIYTTPLDGVKPSKKWEYDENQIKQVSHDFSGRSCQKFPPARAWLCGMYVGTDASS